MMTLNVMRRFCPCHARAWQVRNLLRHLTTYPDDHEALTLKVRRLEARGLPIVHHHDYVCELPIGHRFAMRKFHGVMRFLRVDQVISAKQLLTPELASEEMVTSVHTKDYCHRFFNGLTTTQEQRQTGFEWSEGLVRRCRLETGGTVLAATAALEHGLACSTGGGTHHAFPDRGTGYCLINDLAVTAQHLINTGLVQRVLVVDLDVHQGDGTAAIFHDKDQVFTFSMHCQSNFPSLKQSSDLDLGLDIGLKDEAYLHQLFDHLPGIVDTFRPDLVLFDAGVDPHEKDELGKLKLTDQGLYDRDYYVIKHVVAKGIPCATVIGGGYSQDLDVLSRRHTIVHRAATQVWAENLM